MQKCFCRKVDWHQHYFLILWTLETAGMSVDDSRSACVTQDGLRSLCACVFQESSESDLLPSGTLSHFRCCLHKLCRCSSVSGSFSGNSAICAGTFQEHLTFVSFHVKMLQLNWDYCDWVKAGRARVLIEQQMVTPQLTLHTWPTCTATNHMFTCHLEAQLSEIVTTTTIDQCGGEK